ncbi:hypothetical protein [Pseudomonas aeruginosa]|uniref:hypothetical protein n=1 Tax=Pseudomonas aeruginosa TaxID=287 RepID=UPI00313CF10D
MAGLQQLNWASEGVGATAAALVDLSTVAGNKISNPPWVKFQSAGWVNFPSAPTGLYHRAIEDMDFGRLDAKSRVLSVFAEQVSFILVRDFKNLLSFAPRYRELGQGNRLMVCYLVGVEEACKMRIDFVTDDSDAGDKFGAGLQVRYQQGLLDLPDQLL